MKVKYTQERTKAEFINKVYPEPNTGCWLWAGAVTRFGYGSVLSKSHSGFTNAHRYSFFAHYGEFDRSKHVLHTCDNSACVNPQHLYLGDHKQNARDREDRGRRIKFKGTDNGNSILSDDQVSDIRSRYQFRSPNNTYSLAREFGVSQPTIHCIVTGKLWKQCK
jgi:hypothetical protein